MIAPLGKMLIGAGALLVAAGAVVILIERFGWSRLPGDIFVQRGRVTFYFPVVTCLVVSIVLSLIMSLLSRWRR